MTIMFVTAQDSQTLANLAIAHDIVEPADQRLFGDMATRHLLHQALENQQNDRTVFSMSHGSKVATIAQDNLQAINRNDGITLNGFRVFAWACHTGASLGHSIAQGGAIWWGYDCAVTAPDDRVEYLNIFAPIFRLAKAHLVAATDTNGIETALSEIRQACLDALDSLDAIGAAQDSEAFSIYSCCNQIWERLSVWISLNPNPIRHASAPPAYIDL